MADRLLSAYNSSPQRQRRYSDPTLRGDISVMTDLFNTRTAHTQAGTPLGLHSLWVSGPNSQDATTAALGRGGPGGNLDSNRKLKDMPSPNGPAQQAERDARGDDDDDNGDTGFTSFTVKSTANAGNTLQNNLAARDAAALLHSLRTVVRGLIAYADNSKTAIMVHKLLDPKADLWAILGALLKILKIKISGTPDAKSVQALSKPDYVRLEDALRSIDMASVAELAHIMTSKIVDDDRQRIIIEQSADSMIGETEMDPAYLAKILKDGSRATCLSEFAHATVTSRHPVTYQVYTSDVKLYKAATSRSMVHPEFNVVDLYTKFHDEFERLEPYARQFCDITLPASDYQLIREIEFTPPIGELRVGTQTLLKSLLDAVRNGQPRHKILQLATKADREIQEFRVQCNLPTRDQAIAARTAAAKQKDVKAAAALVAEPTPSTPPPRGDDRDRKAPKSPERKELEKPIIRSCLRTKPSPDNKKHTSNACIKYNVARILDKKSHTDAAEACQRSCKKGRPCQHLHVLSSDIGAENERVAAATSLDAQD